jgi:catechol 2,3-dioxygenase-like lactoylglutathione lyase family enzyme
MKKGNLGFCLAAQMAVVVAFLWLNSVGTRSKVAVVAAQDGVNAQSILNLQPQHATISVANISVETAWYVEKLGFTSPPSTSLGGGGMGQKMKGGRVDIAGFSIHLIQYEGSQRPQKPSPIFMQQGWIHLTFSVSDMEKALSFLRASGVEVEVVRNKSNKLTALVLHDPEGNEVELDPR